MTIGVSIERQYDPMTAPGWFDAGFPHIWLPYSQMKTAAAPLPVARTQGSRIVLADGRELIDGIASWWTAVHGYNHPHIVEAITRQAAVMPHVMLGGLLHEQAATLAARLTALLPGGLTRVFFSDSGSVAVEVAMKMALQFWLNRGVRSRTRFLAFKGGYHGDTIATMAVCDPEEGMHALYTGILTEHYVIDLPRDESSIAAFEAFLETHADALAGILVEPLVQGAGGMIFHNEQTLRRLRAAADKYDLLLIFDEIFTGFGRTGAMFACEAGGVAPDIMTVGKGLTGGTLPLAATIATQKVFEAFWSDDPLHALMHGPTYMGNALACAAANASLDLFARENRLLAANEIGKKMGVALGPCLGMPGVIDVRVRGAIGVVEVERIDDREALKRAFLAEGVWIRPLRNVVYLTPALTISDAELAKLTSTIVSVLGGKKPSF
jgi:adenosylmethionine---8-amino-7-oxononanoate aminotransferase